MDQHCQEDHVTIHWLTDDDVLIVHGKTHSSQNFKECVIMFGPDSMARKKTTHIEFLSYDINDCGVSLALQQSPGQIFGQDYSQMVNILFVPY